MSKDKNFIIKLISLLFIKIKFFLKYLIVSTFFLIEVTVVNIQSFLALGICIFFKQFFHKFILFLIKLAFTLLVTRFNIFVLSCLVYFILISCSAYAFAYDDFCGFADHSIFVAHIQDSWLYKSCKTTEDRALVLSYFLEPHYRCAIFWYVSCYYSYFRPNTSLSYLLPRFFPWPKMTEADYLDCCLGTLDLETIKEIIVAAEAIPGFSEYWRPVPGYFIHPVERQPWMESGPVLPYWRVLAIMTVTVFIFLVIRF